MLASLESNFLNLKFLRKTILACFLGAQMGSIHEKIEVTNLMTLPLKAGLPEPPFLAGAGTGAVFLVRLWLRLLLLLLLLLLLTGL